MAYCRWSSDDYQCDIYAYESDCGGFSIRVANYRFQFSEPLPPAVDMSDTQAFVERHNKVLEMLHKARRTQINLSRDGQSFDVTTSTEAVKLLESLRDEGYRVPDYAIQALREEYYLAC